MDTFHPKQQRDEEEYFFDHKKEEEEEEEFPCCIKGCTKSFPSRKKMFSHVRNSHAGKGCDSDESGESGSEAESDGDSDASDMEASDEELSEEENDESDEELELEDDDPELYEEIAEKAWKPYRMQFDNLVEKFTSEGQSESEAKQSAYNLVLTGHRKTFRNEFTEMLLKMEQLRQDPTYKAVMKTAKRLREDDENDFDESIRSAVNKRKYLINELVSDDYQEYDDDDDDEEEEQED